MGFDDADLERFLILLDKRQLSPATTQSLVWQFKKQKSEIASLRESLATRSKLLLEAHKILLDVYDTDKLSLETKLAASKLLDKIELDESLFEIEKTKE